MTVPLIPREVLFGNPERIGPRLSPDGERLAFLAPKDGVLNVWVGPVGAPLEDFGPVTDDRKRGIRVCFWAEDNQHIVYLQDEGGDENWRVHAVDASTKEDRDLTPFDDVRAQIVDKSRHFPDTLLVALNRDNPELHDVYRLTLSTGGLQLAAKNPGNVVGWVADAEFEVRAAMAATPDGGFDLLLRDTEDADWRKLFGWDKEDALSSTPVGFTQDGTKLYLLDSREANAARLVLLDLASGDVETLIEDPRYDVGQVLTNPETHEVQAAAVERARTDWVVLDDDVKEDFEVIADLRRGDFAVASRDRADENWLVSFTADDGGASYYSYDRETRSGGHLFDARPDLAEYDLARMEPVSFTSRDGLTIEGYLTLPPGNSERPVPMVLDGTVARGRVTGGATTPKRSGSPTGVTPACRSTTGARRATAKNSSTLATRSGAAGCTTTSATRSDGPSRMALQTRSGSPSTAGLTADTRRSSGPLSRRTSSGARWTSWVLQA
jgi:dipeptidyl aminopeptidase/acylaminoacyl peptidase